MTETGNVNPNRSVRINGIWLGTWLTDKRVKKVNNLLSPVQIAELESVGINWTPPNGDIERGIALLTAFKKREGHAMVPDRWVEDGFPLGEWLVNRRQFYKKGKILPEHMRAMNKLGVVWDVNDFKWERAISAVRDFLKSHEVREVLRGVHHNGVNIGSWRDNTMHNYRKGKLSEKRIRDLEKLGLLERKR